MKMNGEQLIDAPRQVVWDSLNDPEILRQSITGCKEINKVSDTEFDAKVTMKIGPVKANFTGAVKLSRLDPPNSYVISGQGKGGAAGFAKGGAEVALSDEDGKTLLTYTVDAQVGGKLAQIGSRLVSSAARKMADDFFKKFKKLVENADVEPEKPARKTAAKKASAKKAIAKKGTKKKTSAAKAPARATAAPKPSPAAPVSAVPAASAGQPASHGPSSKREASLLWITGAAVIAAIAAYYFF